jgi:NADPH:quinone reductase-like Zn-dependent oxidoreductase
MSNTTQTMKVGLVEKADCFVIKEADRPVISNNEVLIKVHTVGVNFADIMHIKGTSPLKPPTGIVGSE